MVLTALDSKHIYVLQLKHEVRKLFEGGSLVQFVFIPGHSVTTGNELADVALGITLDNVKTLGSHTVQFRMVFCSP